MDDSYELCVIGAGTAGFAAAERARADGRNVVVVTGAGALGGTCILRGCMPAKTLLSSTQALGEVEDAPELGVQTERVHVDVPAIIRRKHELVDYFAEDRVKDLEAYPLVRGTARFVSREAIEVDGRRISAQRFVIATGSHIVPPAVPGLAECGYLTSDDVLELKRIPKSIAVIGGGPVGCEFAQYFRRLGAHVSLIEDGPTLLRKEDADIGRAVAAVLRDEGVEVLLNAGLARCEKTGDGVTLSVRNKDRQRDLAFDSLMLATGRVPHIERLDLAAAGVRTSGSAVAVDAFLRTSNSAVFAAGDALGRRCLVHVAEYAGTLAAANAFASQPKPADFERFEAHAVYTQPQVAVAGLTERDCTERGIAVNVRRHPFSDVGKALVSNEAEGFVKMIAEPGGRIRGIALVGDEAIDLIGEAIALLDRHASLDDVTSMPHLHPTLGEIYARVAEDFAKPAAA